MNTVIPEFTEINFTLFYNEESDLKYHHEENALISYAKDQ